MLNNIVNHGTILSSMPFNIIAEILSNGGTAGLKQLEKKSFSILALAESVEADTSFMVDLFVKIIDCFVSCRLNLRY